MPRSGLLASLLVIAALTGSAQEADSARGPELLAPFKSELQQALREGLANGPAEAIAACRHLAPEIAESLSRDGVVMGRSSHRLRNPANAAPEWVTPLLNAYLDNAADREPHSVQLSDARLGYVEPILLQPLCLTCHGETLAPDISARIDALYPDDRAIGFEVGDFRGLFWVEYPATGE